jgi:hypothetical protein
MRRAADNFRKIFDSHRSPLDLLKVDWLSAMKTDLKLENGPAM